MFHTSVTKLSLENQSLDVNIDAFFFNSNSLFCSKASLGSIPIVLPEYL